MRYFFGKGKWKLDTSKKLSDYKDLIGTVNTTKPIYRSTDATIAKALAGLSFRNKIFETYHGQLTWKYTYKNPNKIK